MRDWGHATKQREVRRGYEIRAYVGPNGGGKSTCAVWDLLPSLDAGRAVLSTARLLDFRNPRPCDDEACTWPGHPFHPAAHPLWVPFTDWRQFLEFRDGDVLLDEVAGVASSRESGSLPFQVARELQKLRKRGVTLSYTAPSFQRTEKIIREVTKAVTFCQGRFPVRDTDETGVRAWRRNRLLRWMTYDATELEKFTSTEREEGRKSEGRVRIVERQTFRIAGSLAAVAFESGDEVLSLGWASEAGVCLECGGRRPIPRCSCGDSHGLVDEDGPASAGGARSRTRRSRVSVPLSVPESA